MNLTLWQEMVLFFIYYLLLIEPLTYYTICQIMDIKLKMKNVIVVSLIVSILLIIVDIFAILIGQKILETNVLYMLNYYFSIFFHIIVVYYVNRVNFIKLFITTNIITIIAQGSNMLINFIFALFLSSYVKNEMIASITILILVPVTFILLFKMLIKLKLREFLNASLYSRKSSIIMFIICLVLPSVIYNVYLLDSFVENFMGLRMPVLGILVILIEFIVIFYLSANGMSRAKIQSLETTTQQQQIYMQELEQMQQEMRIFRHDYKNMMSSIYLQTQEGQIEKVADFIEKSVINFDNKVGNKIKQSTQLQNVQIIEVKSLLLTKLLIMNDRGIDCKLEVIYPVTEVNMILEEFITCLGILIDNAIEAVENTYNPEVEILISAQKTCLTVMISNNSLENIDCCQIFNYGYSTKGKNRGIGLFSYKQLTNKYTNIATSTSCNNKVFIQELKIRGIQ